MNSRDIRRQYTLAYSLPKKNKKSSIWEPAPITLETKNENRLLVNSTCIETLDANSFTRIFDRFALALPHQLDTTFKPSPIDFHDAFVVTGNLFGWCLAVCPKMFPHQVHTQECQVLANSVDNMLLHPLVQQARKQEFPQGRLSLRELSWK